MSTQGLIIVLAVAAILAIAYWRFDAGRYGSLRPDRDVADAYETFRVDPGRVYYTSGPDEFPNAIMGIDRPIAVGGELWKKRELNEAGMERLVAAMQSRALARGAPLHGFLVVDPDGVVIGDWYSILGLQIVIRQTGEKRVSISTPPLEIHPAGD